MIASAVNWTEVLIVGVPGYIAAIGGAIAAVKGTQNRRSLRTSSGDSIGVVTERAHDTGIANNLLLRALNGETKPADPDELHALGTEPPSIPVEHPDPPKAT